MTSNFIQVLSVNEQGYTPADIQIHVSVHGQNGIVSSSALYLTEDEATELLSKLTSVLNLQPMGAI